LLKQRIFIIHIYYHITVTWQFTPLSSFQNQADWPQFCTVCHNLSVLPPLIIPQAEALELFCTVALRSVACYLSIPCTLRTRVFAILLSPRDKGRIYLCHFSQNLCCLVREFGTVNCISKYLPTDSTFNSPDSCSTAICVASRYSILATLFCGCALRRIRVRQNTQCRHLSHSWPKAEFCPQDPAMGNASTVHSVYRRQPYTGSFPNFIPYPTFHESVDSVILLSAQCAVLSFHQPNSVHFCVCRQ